MFYTDPQKARRREQKYQDKKYFRLVKGYGYFIAPYFFLLKGGIVWDSSRS